MCYGVVVPDQDPRKILGLPDPDPSLFDPDPSIIKQKSSKTLDFYYFVTSS